VSKVTKMRQ